MACKSHPAFLCLENLQATEVCAAKKQSDWDNGGKPKKRKVYKDLTQKLINILNDDYDKDSPEMNLKMLRKRARQLKI